MTLAQKVGRVLLFSATLVTGSVIAAILGAVGLYLMEKGHEIDSTTEFVNGATIIIVGVLVNAICIIVLLELKKTDHKFIPPKK